MTRQAYYAHHKRLTQKALQASIVVEMTTRVRNVHPRIGGRKLYQLLKPELELHGIKLGRDGLFTILADNNLLIKKRKRRVHTTQSYHHFHKHPNLIEHFTPYQADQLWVSDITYIRSGERFYYLFLITDAYSRRIVGYHLGKSLEVMQAVISLRMALDQRQAHTEGLIHHSDRGLQYCSHEYVNLLQDNHIRISMTQDGNPLHNSIAERVNGILKDEYLYELNGQGYQQLKHQVTEAVYRYNQLRPHLSCNLMTPNEAHRHHGPLPRKWKNYRALKSPQSGVNH